MRRTLPLLVVLGVAGCGMSPGSLGITGPGAQPTPLIPSNDDSTVGTPGIPDRGGVYGPSIGPLPSNGQYFNYN